MTRAQKVALANELLAKIEELRDAPKKMMARAEAHQAELAARYGEADPCVQAARYPYAFGSLEGFVRSIAHELEDLVRDLLPQRRGRGRR